MSEHYLVTVEGYRKLLCEHERLKKELDEIQFQMGREASIDNDLRENPMYMELRRRAEYTLPKKLAEIEHALASCQVISNDELAKIDTSIVRFGTRVTIADEDGKISSYEIVGYGESDPNLGRISYLAPFARKLLGKKVGDTVLAGSREAEREVEIISINRLIESITE